MAKKDKKTELTNREKYLINSFKLDEVTVKSISEFGRLIGTHKYDIWIAKEFKKNKELLNNLKDIQYIIDWAKQERPNISELTFEQALEKSKYWHSQLKFNENLQREKNIEDERIIYKCKDKKHFFILLRPEDLDEEGEMMGNCVGTYKDKVMASKCLIVSLRDEKNQSHVTIEIDTETGTTIQVKGKKNEEPIPKYQKLITEFAIFASGYNDVVDEELLEIMNMKFEN